MINVPNMRKTLEMMALDPASVDQSTWVCRTTACMAGHAAALVGKWKHNQFGDPVVVVNGAEQVIGTVAEEVLGFDGCLHEAFFLRTSGLTGQRAVAVLYRMAEIVTANDITMPVELEPYYMAANAEWAAFRPGRTDDLAHHYLRDVL